MDIRWGKSDALARVSVLFPAVVVARGIIVFLLILRDSWELRAVLDRHLRQLVGNELEKQVLVELKLVSVLLEKPPDVDHGEGEHYDCEHADDPEHQ